MGYTYGTSIESKTRICTKCGKEFPNTNEFFSYANKKTGRLNAVCRECQKIINKENRLKIIEKNKNKDLFYPGTRHCKKCNRDLPNNKLYFPIDLSCVDGLRNVCRECSKNKSGFLDPNYTVFEKWTDEENNILLEKYKDFTGEELHNLFLPNRTIRSIECHASFLGLQGKNHDAQVRANLSRSIKNSEKLKGRILSEETKKKISTSKKEYFKTHNGWWKGKKRSPEQCKMISEKQRGKWAGDKNPRHLNPLIGEENGRWMGGINSTYVELRSDIKDWFNESMEFCNYKCVITGGGFDNIHHTTAFRDIVDEVFKTTGVEVKQQVCDYTKEDFEELRSTLKYLHVLYGYGACVNKKIHKLFHDNYGYKNFSPFDFLDFLYRIDLGKFDDWFTENNLKININYEYVEYLESTLSALAESA